MIDDDNMETWMKSLVNTYFGKVQERVRNGKGVVEIINENLVDNAELMIQADIIREQTNRENYWENVTKIAELARKYGVERQNDFYGRVYELILEMTQEYFQDDRIYTLKDFNEFRSMMQAVYDVAGMPDYIRKTGKTPEKIFLKSVIVHSRETAENFQNQMVSLLRIIKDGNMELGESTEDLEDFCVKVASAYDMLELNGTKEKRMEFARLFLHNYLNTNNLRATSVQIRRANGTKTESNEHLDRIRTAIEKSPDFEVNPILTPELMQEMARNPEVQECIPDAGETLQRMITVEKTQVEH